METNLFDNLFETFTFGAGIATMIIIINEFNVPIFEKEFLSFLFLVVIMAAIFLASLTKTIRFIINNYIKHKEKIEV